MKSIQRCLVLALSALLLLCALPVSAASAVLFDAEVPNSVTEEQATGNGLAFYFTLHATGVTYGKEYRYIPGSGTVEVDGTTYPLQKMGAVVSNSGGDGLSVESADGKHTVDIPGVYLMDVAAATVSYAVRIIRIPDEKKSSSIYARPYFVYEKDGEEVAVYGDVDVANYQSVWDGVTEDPPIEEPPVVDPTVPVASAQDVALTSATSVKMNFTPEADGILTVSISGTPGWQFSVGLNRAKKGTALETHTYDLIAGTSYEIVIKAYDTVKYAQCAGTVSYDITFAPAELEVVKAEYSLSSTSLAVGTNAVSLDPAAVTTLYNFYSPESGIYTISVPANASLELSQWIPSTFKKDVVAQNGALEIEAIDAGQRFMFGLSGDMAGATITIEKTGDAAIPPEMLPWTDYEGTHTPSLFSLTLVEGESLVDVSIAAGAGSCAVYNSEDGYYHLNSADGPVLYVNFTNSTASLAEIMDHINVGAYLYDAQGNLLSKESYSNYLRKYYYIPNTMYDPNGVKVDMLATIGKGTAAKKVYPLNADLKYVLETFGGYYGWWNETSPNYLFDGESIDSNSAWMFMLCYVTAQ